MPPCTQWLLKQNKQHTNLHSFVTKILSYFVFFVQWYPPSIISSISYSRSLLWILLDLGCFQRILDCEIWTQQMVSNDNDLIKFWVITVKKHLMDDTYAWSGSSIHPHCTDCHYLGYNTNIKGPGWNTYDCLANTIFVWR